MKALKKLLSRRKKTPNLLIERRVSRSVRNTKFLQSQIESLGKYRV